jgi:hypothetical protein
MQSLLRVVFCQTQLEGGGRVANGILGEKKKFLADRKGLFGIFLDSLLGEVKVIKT